MRPARRAYLDWLRGFAVLCMIEWHVIASWTMPSDQVGDAWPIIEFIGGLAAPLFLFLAGLAVPFAVQSYVGRGQSPAEASWLVQKRGWQVFLIAHLFRLQSFLTKPDASVSSIFKPDILNILGLALVATAWLTGRLRRADGRIRGSGLLAAAIAILVLTPWARIWWWPTLLHPRLEAYIRKVNGYGVFEIFPWVAYAFVGAFIGSLLVPARDPARESRVHYQLGAGGLVTAGLGYVLAYFVTLPQPVAWSIQPWPLFLIQTGFMTAAIWFTWAIFHLPWIEKTSGPMVLFGRTSLFVYWLHVELAFGFMSYPIHRALPLTWSIAGFVLMTIAMYFAARWWAGRPSAPWIPAELRAGNSQLNN